MSVIEVKNLTYGYSHGTPFEITALKDISFSVEKGEVVGIIGHTGSGKSTLIQMLNALLKPDKGQVLVDGKDINADKNSAREARKKVGLCFQYPEYQLFEETCAKDIAFGPKNMGFSETEVKQRVMKAAYYAGFDTKLLGKSPFYLSGGQKRRCAIAGVMAMLPEVLILDEPTAGLDPRGRREILEMIKFYREQSGATVMFVSHSMDDTAKLADKILVMDNGSLALQGGVREIFGQAGRLIELGLNVPAATRIVHRLRSLGCSVCGDVFTLEEAADELSSFLNGRRGS